MTGAQALETALKLLNYTDNNGHIDNANSQEYLGRGLVILNQIYADLWQMSETRGAFKPLTDMNETVVLSEDVCRNAMVYGVAMLMAQSLSDGDNQALYASLYNKRRTYNAGVARRIDMLPRGCDW
jgi:hypothetical protein